MEQIKSKKILIDIIESEKTHLLSDNRVDNVSANANLSIQNPSDSHRLWNLRLKLDETVMTSNLQPSYSKDALEPNTIWKFNYDIVNLHQPILEFQEIIDTSRDNEGFNHNFVMGEKNDLRMIFLLKNVTEQPIQNIILIKQIPDYFRETKINESTMGTTDLNVEMQVLTWKVPSIEPNQEIRLELNARAEISDSTFKSGNDVRLNYESDMNSRSNLTPSIEALTDSMTSIDQEEDDDRPGWWNCEIEFENESDFEVTVKSLKIDQEIVTGKDEFVNIQPKETVSSHNSWIHNFSLASVSVPTLNSSLDFTANFDVHTKILGEIIKMADTFKVLETETQKSINPSSVNANANTNMNVISTIINRGTANVDALIVSDTIPRDFQVPEVAQITASIVDGTGETLKKLFVENLKYSIMPDNKEVSVPHTMKFEVFELGDIFQPGCKMIIEYPIIARNPQPGVLYESPLESISYTLPRGSGFPDKTDKMPVIGINYVKRKIKTGKSISPSGQEGVFNVTVKINNKGGVELQNITLIENIPNGFTPSDIKPENISFEFKEGAEQENSQLIWKIPMINPSESIKIKYSVEGKGDFPRHEPKVIIPETESMKKVGLEGLTTSMPKQSTIDEELKSESETVEETMNEPRVVFAGKSEEKEKRVVCPHCGSINVATVDDKSNAITYISGVPVYGKKFYCKQCSWEWK
ncbi:MAG: hypothetical protein ACTSVU_06980 [Promethearchaeota archaeon]